MIIFTQNLIVMEKFTVTIADHSHLQYAKQISEEMESSAKIRGTGISLRSEAYLQEKMLLGNAVVALRTDGKWAGFCYIESWQSDTYIANSGLIVAPEFRKYGLAKRIKEKILELSSNKYPQSKIFGLTTGLAVMKINSELGFEPVTYSELTSDQQFWNGCKSCVNYSILESKSFKNCLCTAMLYEPLAQQPDDYPSPLANIAEASQIAYQ